MKKKTKVIIVAIIVAVVIALLGVGVLLFTLFGKTKVNGVMIDNRNVVAEFKENFVLNNTFVEDDYNQFVKYNYDISRLTRRNVFTKIADTISKRNVPIKVTKEIDYDGIKKKAKKHNKHAKKSKNAKIVIKKDKYKIKKAKYGTVIDIKKLIKEVKEGATEIYVVDFYKQPKIKDKDLKKKVKKLNNALKWHITYKNGEKIKITPDMVKRKKNEITIDEQALWKEAYKVLATYDTIGGEWEFKDHKGKKRKAKGGTWGSAVNYDAEMKFIQKAYDDDKSYNKRKPELLRNFTKYSKERIEISLKKQHLWVYKKKKVIMDTGVVTGLPTKERATPAGAFYISECVPGKYLKGRGYKTWVNKWMRLTTSGVGLHDAPWQPTFGGTRYLVGGSHGCINLPPKFADKLFKRAFVGETVFIY